MYAKILLLSVFLIAPVYKDAFAQQAPGTYASQREQLFTLAEARGRFNAALNELENKDTAAKERRRAAIRLEQNIDIVLRYLRTVSNDRPLFEPGELQLWSRDEIALEVLSLAHRIQPQL